ncbi:hypothetical protein COO60DRAFT_1477480 [Scenedesmus sp. NREL 46B-D3]|nr:hypothetical protein COO60DRAFT_1477480 [Scenedesmus sp. NREL 46B-D3]
MLTSFLCLSASAAAAAAAAAAALRQVARAAAELEQTVNAYRQHQDAQQQLEEARLYLKEEAASDPVVAEFAREEIAELEGQVGDLETQLKLLLLPKDPLDERDIMLEIRAGAGGDEAGIWAGDLLRMYQRYAQGQGWKARSCVALQFYGGRRAPAMPGLAAEALCARCSS